MSENKVTRWLRSASDFNFSLYCTAAAFATYFCMYAFRKPFSVALFPGSVDLPLLPPMDYKIVLIVAQVIGYTISKFIGIKVISEMSGRRRYLALLGMIGFAELALLLFAIVPKPYNIFCIFLNGMPLGMVWGLVFGYLEGRHTSELLGAGLSASYIVASGAVKTVGRTILSAGVSEFWMPFVTGLCFFPFLLLSATMLKWIPVPTKEDEALRTRRAPMDGETRLRFFSKFAPGLISLTVLYMFLTAYRDFRDNFAREIWDAVGYAGKPMIFTASELPIAMGVLLTLALLYLIKDNKKAVTAIHGIMLAGSVLIGLSTMGYQLGLIGPATWMVLVGLGLYLGYVPYGCVLFDRLIAAVGFVATAGFMIYMTDAFGYLGSVALMFYKNFGQPDLSWLDFFIGFSYATSLVTSAAFLYSLLYFRRATRR